MILLNLIILFKICLAENSTEQTKCPKIISRTQWGARKQLSVTYLIIPIPYVIIHHSVTSECDTMEECSTTVRNIQSHHMDTNNWDDIGPSFLVGNDGNVYEGCGWTSEGAHTYGYNKKSIGVMFLGNFQEKEASQSMLDVVRQLINCGKSKGFLQPNVHVIGARQVKITVSPGNKLYNQIQAWPEWLDDV